MANVFNLSAQTPRVFHIEAVNAAGGITAEEFGNQAMTTRVFDEAYRLSYQETSQRPLLGGAQTTPFQRLKYEYGPGSVLAARHDPSKQLSEHFQHDFLGRLTQWKVVQTTGAVCRGGIIDYGFDDAGNLLSRTASGTGLSVLNSYGSAPGVTGGANALTSTTEGSAPATLFSYDASGNQERAFFNRRPSSAADVGDAVFTWTHFNLPHSIIDNVRGLSTTLSYDASHARVLRVSANESVLTLAGLYEERTSPSGSTTRLRNVVADGRVVAQVTSTGGIGQPLQTSIAYLHADSLGSPDAVTSGAPGQSFGVERAKFDPFGERRNPDDVAQPQPQPNLRSVGFTGHEPDDFAQLTNMRGRIYNQRTGRFISADPLVASAAFGQSFNRYSYVLNSPLMLTDPSGFEPVSISAAGGGAIAFGVMVVLAFVASIITSLLQSVFQSAASAAPGPATFAGATPSGTPDAGTRASDDGLRQDWGDASRLSPPSSPVGAVECKGGMCFGTPTEFPKFRFGWPQGDPHGQGEFVQLTQALSQHVKLHPESGAQLNEMFDSGAVFDVALRVPSGPTTPLRAFA